MFIPMIWCSSSGFPVFRKFDQNNFLFPFDKSTSATRVLSHRVNRRRRKAVMSVGRYFVVYGVGVVSMLAGASVVHNFVKPDLVSEELTK